MLKDNSVKEVFKEGRRKGRKNKSKKGGRK
jgi:hypothetical protein